MYQPFPRETSDFTRFQGEMRFTLPTILLAPLLLASLALSAPAGPRGRLHDLRGGTIPSPAAMACDLKITGRTSCPRAIEVARIGRRIPRTFSRDLLSNTEGFEWYVSRHYALKTDLSPEQAQEALQILELGLPHLEAMFGRRMATFEDRRMAMVFAASRASLQRAMISDHLYLLRLGGITQEGIWCAYQYAGSPYHNRYILLHEATHLYQYCLSGNTRQFYGFFIEGIADFFSSHVFDPATQSLTINVLDRAPSHNHLVQGLEEWNARDRPSFRRLYRAANNGRGLDVLMTAFLQSTPAWEQHWRWYCERILRRGRADADPRTLSDCLLTGLYGSWGALDAAFDAWMQRRRPSFEQVAWGFDQEGDTLVSHAPRNGPEAVMRLPAPEAPAIDDAFSLDAPARGRHALRVRAEALFAPQTGPIVGCSFAGAPDGTAGLWLGMRAKAPAWRLTLDTTRWVTVEGPSTNLRRRLPAVPGLDPDAPCTLAVQLGDDALRLAAWQGDDTTVPVPPLRLAFPLEAASRQALLTGHVAVAASQAGWRLTPFGAPLSLRAPPPGIPTNLPLPTVRDPAPSTRFDASRALTRIYRAERILDDCSPPSLSIARDLLLQRAGGARPTLLLDDDLQRTDFWRGLARDIHAGGATPSVRNSALRELAGLELRTTLSGPDEPGRVIFLAALTTAAPGPVRGRLNLSVSGNDTETRRSSGVRLAPGSQAVRRLAVPPPGASAAFRALARTEVQWLDVPVALQAEVLGNPGIRTWWVLGPFPVQTEAEGPAPFPGDFPDRPDLQAIFTAEDGTLFTWKMVSRPPGLAADADHLVHFTRVFRRQANDCSAYAWTSLVADRPQKVFLSLGASDSISAWVNGQPVHEDRIKREWAPDNLRIPIALREGKNTILLKSTHGQGLWFLSGRIETATGRPAPGIMLD